MSSEDNGRRETLRVLLQTNEEHMTHVESEEFQFISLYLVAVSFIVSAILAAFFDGNVDRNNVWVIMIALAFLIILGIIVYWQIKRWNQVFQRRKEVFNSILSELIIEESDEEESKNLSDLIKKKSELKDKIRKEKDEKIIKELENDLEDKEREIDKILREYTGANNMYLYEAKKQDKKKDYSIRYSDKSYFKARKEGKKHYIKTFVLVRWFIAIIILLALILIVGTALYLIGVL